MAAEVELGGQAGLRLARQVILLRLKFSYLTLRHKRSQKTLSRARPSMLTCMLAASRQVVKASAVNCAPWWVLKILGRAVLSDRRWAYLPEVAVSRFESDWHESRVYRVFAWLSWCLQALPARYGT